MEEKVYKTMHGCGVVNLIMGIIITVVGITSGVLLIISGAQLMSKKSKVLF